MPQGMICDYMIPKLRVVRVEALDLFIGSGSAVPSPVLTGLPKAFPSLMTLALPQYPFSTIVMSHIKKLCVSPV